MINLTYWENLIFFWKVVSKISIFYSSGGKTPCYSCSNLCLQMSTIIIFGTLQNNVWLMYIFRIFFRLVVPFHYGHLAFTIFQRRIPKWLLSNSKAVITYEDYKKRQTHGFIIWVPVLTLPIFWQSLLRNGKISSNCFETSEHDVQMMTTDDSSKLTSKAF